MVPWAPFTVLPRKWPGGYPVWANIEHRNGVASAKIFYTTDPASGWTTIDLPAYAPNDTTWSYKGFIPQQPEGSTVNYYIEATAGNGKTTVHPLTAPAGGWKFCVTNSVSSSEVTAVDLKDIYPNPASAITCIPVSTSGKTLGSVRIYNALGQQVATVFAGEMPAGTSNYFLDAGQYAAGTYVVQLQTSGQTILKKLIIR